LNESGNNGGEERALVVANERVSGPELRRALTERLGAGVGHVYVVAPALAGSGFKHTMGDIDDAIGPARERLRATVEELRAAGFEASGEVGDSEPLQAISDEIEKFHPDQVLVVAHPDAEGAFAERGLLEQAERDLDVPIVELLVDRAEDPHLLGVEETEPGAGRRSGWEPSHNWPPLTGGDVAGILVAILGTLALAGLAALCIDDPDHTDPACIARMLLALAFALLNLAHVVGLFLFESVGYRGMFSRFFARISLVGTPVAVAVSLLLGLLM
jgi:hypothetical protein